MKKLINNLVEKTRRKELIWDDDPSLSFDERDICRWVRYENKIIVITKRINHVLASYNITIGGLEIREYSSKIKEIFKLLKL